jgi:hypothetical protein
VELELSSFSAAPPRDSLATRLLSELPTRARESRNQRSHVRSASGRDCATRWGRGRLGCIRPSRPKHAQQCGCWFLVGVVSAHQGRRSSAVESPKGLVTATVQLISLGYTILRDGDDDPIFVSNSIMMSTVVIRIPDKDREPSSAPPKDKAAVSSSSDSPS